MRLNWLNENEEFAIGETRRAVLFSVFGVAILTAAQWFTIFVGLTEAAYASPYVAMTAVLSKKVCVRAGFLAAFMSITIYNLVFVPPSTAFSIPGWSETTAYVAMIAAAYMCGKTVFVLTERKMEELTGKLPFVTKKNENSDKSLHKTGLIYWDVARTGDWVEDLAHGEELARQFMMHFVHSQDARPLVAWIVRDMIEGPKGGVYSGVEAGFIQYLARASIPGYTIAAKSQKLQSLAAQNHPNNGGRKALVVYANG